MEFRPLLGFIGEWLDEMGFEKQKLIWDAIINSAEEAVEKAHGKITALDLFPDPLVSSSPAPAIRLPCLAPRVGGGGGGFLCSL